MPATERAAGFFAALRMTRGAEFIVEKPLNAALMPVLRMTRGCEFIGGKPPNGPALVAVSE